MARLLLKPVVFLVLCLPLMAQSSPINLMIFGDSLSDSGNIFSVSNDQIPPSPPYGGVFSNGPTWPTQFAANQGLGTVNNVYESPGPLGGGINNFAVGGAFSRTLNVPVIGVETNNANDARIGFTVQFPGLVNQVELFDTLTPSGAPDDAWYVVWAGANDLLFAENFGSTPQGFAEPAVDAVQVAVEAMADKGADDFLLINMPNIGLTPFAVATGTSAEFSEAATIYNLALEAMAADFATDFDVNVRILDLSTLFDELVANPGANGFIGVGPCIDTSDPNDIRILCPPGVDPSDFIFFDPVHPSSATHALIADAVARLEVPEPTTVLLLLGLPLVWGRRQATAGQRIRRHFPSTS